MLKGGYKIVDFRDVNIETENGAVITGIYDGLENNHRKAVMISGVVIDGVEKPNCFVDCEITDGSYTFKAYGKTFTVTAEDKVSIA